MRQRAARNRVAQAVAQQRREIDRFVGTVDAALGINEGVRAGRHRPSRHAAVGQIERVGFQAEEGIVGLVGRHRQHRRRKTALAARKPRLKHRMTGIVGLAGRQDFVVARHQAHFSF